jgi:hypothetical protein
VVGILSLSSKSRYAGAFACRRITLPTLSKYWLRINKATDLNNLVLACAHHHRMLYHSMWSVTWLDGLPWLIPPDFVGPKRRPLRNWAHGPHAMPIPA